LPFAINERMAFDFDKENKIINWPLYFLVKYMIG
jgi:hypothetical protein